MNIAVKMWFERKMPKRWWHKHVQTKQQKTVGLGEAVKGERPVCISRASLPHIHFTAYTHLRPLLKCGFFWDSAPEVWTQTTRQTGPKLLDLRMVHIAAITSHKMKRMEHKLQDRIIIRTMILCGNHMKCPLKTIKSIHAYRRAQILNALYLVLCIIRCRSLLK